MSGSKGKDNKKLKDGIKKLSSGIDDILKQTAVLAKLKKELDGPGLSETESQRIQMTMDRLSKMMEAMSNMMKKVGETQNEITKNLK